MTRARRGAAGLLVAGAVVGVSAVACTGGGGGAQEPGAPPPPSEFAATFQVESPLGLVAGEGQAWVLTSEETGASLSRIDHTGRSTDVARLPGQSHALAPYGDGVVVTRLACAAEECEETAVRVSVVDGGGATVAEEEFAREWGGLVSSFDGRGVELVGVQDDVVWVEVDERLIGYDVADGRTAAQVEAPQGVTCLLADGMHTLVPLDGEYFGHGGIVGPGIPEQRYDAEVHRLDGETWTPVPGSARPLTDTEFQLATCLGGGLHAGERTEASPVWSPGSGWVEREPLRRYPDLATAPEPTAVGSADQMFVLEGAGVIRRWFAGPDGPMSSEVLEVPADLFVQPYAPQVHLMVDVSDTVIAGCVQKREERPTARCWIGSH